MLHCAALCQHTMRCESPVVVVSGLPRSGTSLAMQLLAAGGLPVLSDGERAADSDNPRGYLELERVKSLRTDKAWLDEAAGKAVKVIHLLLLELPADRSYKVVFMEREIDEVLRSQTTMLARLGKQGASLPRERLKEVMGQQLHQVNAWLGGNPCFDVLRVSYRALIEEPEAQVDRIAAFVGQPLDRAAMIRAVDPSLYRNRS